MMFDRPAINFWVKAYQDGCRIIADGNQVRFLAVSNYWERIERYQRFGQFDPDVDIDPPSWVINVIKPHLPGLKPYLTQKPPKGLQQYFWHLLILDYEAKPVMARAAGAGQDVQIISVNGGALLYYAGKREAKIIATPEAPAILSHIGRL